MVSPRTLRARRIAIATLLLATAFGAVAPPAAIADDPAGTIPKGTRLRFHVMQSLASNASTTGQSFAFALLSPIAIGTSTIPTDGTTGSGTVYLAGHAGSSGHEGDLTLRIDSLETVDGRRVTFTDQRLRINGRNRKVASGLLGFVPLAGVGARFIRGSDIVVAPTTPIETVLERSATIDEARTPVTTHSNR